MILSIIFVATLGILPLNLIKIISVICGHEVTLPGLIKTQWSKPTRWYLFYSAFFYQIVWWVNYIGLL